jgi:DnaJ-class molecular chaperone
MKPLLIGCAVLLLVGLVGTCGLVSVIVGAAGNAISGSQPTSGGTQTAPNQSGENASQAQPQQYQQAQQPAMMPCMSCKGSGGQKVACKHCRGSRTMQTRNGYVIVCPNCQGLGVATIPCGGCGGRGTVPYSRDNIYAPRNQDYNPDRAPWEH